MCRGHNKQIKHDGTYKTFLKRMATDLLLSVQKIYSAPPRPSMDRPEAIPCNVVGWMGRTGEMKSLLSNVKVMLVPVSTTKDTSGVKAVGNL